MRHKVKWIFFWICMVLWFGNMFGCATPGNEQNYKSSAPEHPSRFERLDSQRTVPVDDDALGQTVYIADEATPVTPAATEIVAAPVPETGPSLKGIDRSHWAKVKTGPEIGVTRHYPVYFTDYPADRDEPMIDFNDPIEVQLNAALSGTKDHGLIDGHHAMQLLSQPSKFGLDMILLPVRMVMQAPWTTVTTP